MKNKDEVRRSYRREVIHGVGGVGKSTGIGVVSKNPLVLDFDNRWPVELVDKSDFPKVAHEFSDVIMVLGAILNEPSLTQDRIVIDTATKLLSIIEDHVLARDCAGSREKFNAYGYGMKFLRQYFKEILDLVDRIQAKHKVDVTFVCHSKNKDQKNLFSEVYQKSVMDLPEGITELLKQWADFVGYIYFDTVVDKTTKTAKEAIRYISFTENPSYEAKNSSRFPIPLKTLFDKMGIWAEVVFGKTQGLLKDLDTLVSKYPKEQQQTLVDKINELNIRSWGVKDLTNFIEAGKQKLGGK